MLLSTEDCTTYIILELSFQHGTTLSSYVFYMTHIDI